MKIIDQSFEVKHFDKTKELLKVAEGYCKCYNKIVPDSYEEMANYIKRNRMHGSPLEHGIMTVDFVTNRGVSHELVRHRHTAYSQQSTRYCNYSLDRFDNGLTFVLDSSVKDDEKEYLKRLSLGQTAEQARGCLPNDLATTLVVTTNLREWHDILELRTSKKAHYQMRELMIPLLKFVQKELPCVFDDIEI